MVIIHSMQRLISLATLIILFLPVLVSAHGFEVEFDVDPGVLPGSPKYFFERVGEWFEVNILTLSTKKKQARKLTFAEERLAEFKALIQEGQPKAKHLRLALSRYQNFLKEAEDMAEKIIFLDGAEILLAEEVEKITRIHEQVIGEILEEINPDFAGIVTEVLTTVQNENEKIFKFMIQHYQFTEQDIRKHKIIVGEHLRIAQSRINKRGKAGEKAQELIVEARKFQAAGLNIEAYDLVKKAKHVVY